MKQGISAWWAETQQQWLTRVANRTFRNDPNLLDRLAMRFLEYSLGAVPHDPELDHPEDPVHGENNID